MNMESGMFWSGHVRATDIWPCLLFKEMIKQGGKEI